MARVYFVEECCAKSPSLCWILLTLKQFCLNGAYCPFWLHSTGPNAYWSVGMSGEKQFLGRNLILKSSALGVWFVYLLVGIFFFFIWLFPSMVAFLEDQKLCTEVTSARWHCCVFSSLAAVVSCVYLQGFGACPFFHSPWGWRTGYKVQGSFGLTAFWHTARGTPSRGKMTLILDKFVHYFGF